MTRPEEKGPSLEALIENVDLGLEIFHPGGLESTRALAEHCHIGAGTRVLDVASGTGETVCFLAETFQCQAVGVDASEAMVKQAQEKAKDRRLNVDFKLGDAQRLPFDPNTFDAVISECTVCYLDKEAVVREMVRVVKPSGYVGIHDLCWKEAAPEHLKRRFSEIEDERPETLEGWNWLCERAGLVDVIALDWSHLILGWTKDFKKRLGILGQLMITFKVLVRWGLKGLWRIRESERIFRSEHMGYGMIVGRKP